MQFGKLHGIALLVFGVFLLLAQAWISLTPHAPVVAVPPATQSPQPQANDSVAIVHALPGVLGLVCVVGGFAFYMREKDRPTDVPAQPIR